jgi:hypothetical protein
MAPWGHLPEPPQNVVATRLGSGKAAELVCPRPLLGPAPEGPE